MSSEMDAPAGTTDVLGASPRTSKSKPRFGLMGRLVLALLLVGLVPLVLIGAGHGVVDRSMTEQVLRSHSLSARSSAHQAESWLRGQRSAAAALARHPEVVESPTSAQSADLLSGLLQSRPEILAAALLGDEGEELLAARRRDSTPAVDQLLIGPGGESVEWSSADGELWLRLDERILGSDARWLRLIVSGEGLRQLSQPVELGSTAELGLLTPAGEVVVGPEDLPQRLPDRLLEAALSRRIAGAGGGDEEMLAAWAPLATAPWVALSVQPRSEAEAVARQLRQRTGWALGGAVGLILLISSGAWASVVQPLRQLISEQRELAGIGEADTETAGSEIDALRNSFRRLAAQVENQGELNSLTLGRYRIEKVLGQGGMGTVFAAFDPRLERPLAIKTVRVDRLDGEEGAERAKSLLHEAIATARIQHPNVVAVYDLEEHEDLAFLVMERVDGTNLQDLLDRYQVLPPGQVAALGAGIAAGLGAAHERDLVHHDVKPGNVLLGYNGEIKVVDFGIAQFLSAVQEGSGKVFGTPGYLAPEVLQGEPYTESADLFALGVILYQCLVGRRPFSGPSLRSVVLGTIRDQPTPLRTLRPEISEELEDVVLNLLDKTPAQRPSSATRLSQYLTALSDSPWSLLSDDLPTPQEAIPEEAWRRHSRLLPSASSSGDTTPEG
ncbi:MAG: serine/threonine protein kinase [Acidobacteriota bacterium]